MSPLRVEDSVELPKIILVPTDYSACANEAERYAIALAKTLSARLYVMHSWFLPVTKWEGAWALPPDLIAEFAAAARADFERAMSQLRVALPSIEGLLVQGDPRDSIVKAASDVRADLIVMGTHGRGRVSRFLLGSVAESIVRRAPCSVLTVRAAKSD
jgi:nucleotide-binding universal stress UspA family protein